MIVDASIKDAKELTRIALKSKSFWGYSDELIESWREDLTVTSKMLKDWNVCKYVIDDKIVGFYILNQPEDKSIELEFLFVLPNLIGKGIGKKLLNHSIEKGINLNCNEMIVLADPNAKYFYAYKGFETIYEKESSISNRFLPVMKKYLN